MYWILMDDEITNFNHILMHSRVRLPFGQHTVGLYGQDAMVTGVQRMVTLEEGIEEIFKNFDCNLSSSARELDIFPLFEYQFPSIAKSIRDRCAAIYERDQDIEDWGDD